MHRITATDCMECCLASPRASQIKVLKVPMVALHAIILEVGCGNADQTDSIFGRLERDGEAPLHPLPFQLAVPKHQIFPLGQTSVDDVVLYLLTNTSNSVHLYSFVICRHHRKLALRLLRMSKRGSRHIA